MYLRIVIYNKFYDEKCAKDLQQFTYKSVYLEFVKLLLIFIFSQTGINGTFF